MVTVKTIMTKLPTKILNPVWKLNITTCPKTNTFYFLQQKYKSKIHTNTWEQLKLEFQ